MCDKLKEFSSEDFDNVDTPIIFIRKFDEYGLKIWDGGSSSIVIDFCPWCGEKLPTSKRDQWFEEIEKLGIDPWTEDVPDKYSTDAWYRK
ncbi:hypothetical protein LZF95_20875 [Algoriphagus sp. AGSA1]|uniref:DUF6980 family protein n=1 Tax=Algoriphagus sp. AGSA1 TaxID=2907213 RepID=UPI001F26CF06|nr:hypothetical protein [Algoriphagus sp. AGSA1]MCE7057147.1 hypothetical protein [Algoriphagus sp. AGSA1]